MQHMGGGVKLEGPYGLDVGGAPFSVPIPGNHMVGARTVPNAGRAGAAVLGVAALKDAAAAPEGGVIVIFPTLLPSISYQRVEPGRREDDGD